MSELASALAGVVTALQDAGIHATIDPRDLVTPGAWVTLAEVRDPRLCGGYTYRASVCLIVADMGTPTAVEELGKLLELAAGVLTLEEPARPMTVTPPGVGPLPALVITTST